MKIKVLLIIIPLIYNSFAQDDELLLKTFTSYSGIIYSVALSPDGANLAIGSIDKTIKLWDVNADIVIQIFKGHSNLVSSIAFSQDGNTLASGDFDKTIKLWNVNDGTIIKTLARHNDVVTAIAFSPDGNTFASVCRDKMIKLWNLNDGTIIRTLVGHNNDVTSLAFSPDGNTLASGSLDKTIKLWNVFDGAIIQTLTGSNDAVTAVAFSPVFNILASGCQNKTIRLWDVRNGNLIRTFGNGSVARSVIFSTDGTKIFIADILGKVEIWSSLVFDYLLSARRPDLFRLKDEFETTAEYQERKRKSISIKNQLIVELINEEKQKLDQERIKKEKDKNETIEKSKEFISIKIDRIGDYNADQEAFPVTINNKTHQIKIPRSEAREFKDIWQKAKVTGWRQLANDLKSYEYYNITVQHPITGVAIPFGEQRETSQQTTFAGNNQTVLPPNLSISITFLDANGNKFLDAKENGKINLSIKNSGEGSAFGVKFDLQIDSTDNNLTYLKTVYVGEILPNSTKDINIDINASKSVQRKTHTLTLKGYESNGFNPPDAKISFETFPLLLSELILADYGITSNIGDNIIRAGEISNLKIRFQNVGQGLAQNASIVIMLPSNVFFTPDSKTSEKYEIIKQGEYVDLDLSIVPNNLVANEVQINFLIKDENTEVNLPLTLPINKQLASIQELVVKGEENKINIQSVALISSEIEKNIPLTSNKKENMVALVVGISEYQNSNVPKVTYAKRDASLIRQYLEKTFGYDTKNILPRNEDELMTSGTIKNYIKNIIPSYLKQDGSSELFIYFTGHGAPSTKTRNAYFVPYDCDPNYVSDINAYNMNEFYSDIAKLNAQKKIVVIDACFSGQSGDGNMLIKDASPIYVTMENEMSLDDKSIMFLSSGADQVSNWYPEKKHSMFTYFFLKGIQGEADVNKDGSISVAEMESYINDANNGLPYYSNREFQRPQKAVIYGKDLELLSK